jgi:hypothetical protein
MNAIELISKLRLIEAEVKSFFRLKWEVGEKSPPTYFLQIVRAACDIHFTPLALAMENNVVWISYNNTIVASFPCVTNKEYRIIKIGELHISTLDIIYDLDGESSFKKIAAYIAVQGYVPRSFSERDVDILIETETAKVFGSSQLFTPDEQRPSMVIETHNESPDAEE